MATISKITCTATLLALLSCIQVQAQQRSVDLKAGEALFQKEWTHNPPKLPPRMGRSIAQYQTLLKALPGDGLGPMFNATSCEACHAGGGAAGVKRNVTLLTLDPRSPAIQKTVTDRNSVDKIGRQIDDLFPALIAPNGRISLDVVVHESSARPFFDSIRSQLNEGVTGGIPDAWFDREKRTSEAVAMQPVIAGRRGDLDFFLSQRNSPALHGAGLIDRISEVALKKIAYNQAKRTGRRVTGRLGVGKFGWRGQTRSLSAFVAGACAGELGLQVNNTPQPPDFADTTYVSLGSDLNPLEFEQLVSYVGSLPAPLQTRAYGDEWSNVREGRRLFAKVGCADCHVEHISPARGIYSDLLLHDMGQLLSAPAPAPARTPVRQMRIPFFPRENRPFGTGGSIASYYGGQEIPYARKYPRPAEPQFPYGYDSEESAEQDAAWAWDRLSREWRTPPLWGVADSAPYLHDGRAKTLDSAIRWHGGEASRSVELYRSLPKESRRELLDFLDSLKAPVSTDLPKEEADAWFANFTDTKQADEPDENDVSVSVFARGY